MSGPEAAGMLMNLAEIAAAFAGFAALVSVLRERGDRREAAHNILRLRIVISTSVVVVAASLIPIGMLNFGVGDARGLPTGSGRRGHGRWSELLALAHGGIRCPLLKDSSGISPRR